MIPGYDVPAVEAWCETHLSGLRPPFVWTRLDGGHSNLTYELEDAAGATAVIRRPPSGDLQPGAHNMHREYRIISSLWPAGIPVAQPYGECQDPDVTGAHFYVMEKVHGRALPDTAALQAGLSTPERARRATESFVDALAAVHSLDPDEIGLGDLGRRNDYAGRQLTAWYRSWVSSADDAGLDDPRAHTIHDLLAARKPTVTQVRLVHGDYGFHNCLIADDATVAAIVDWEVASLGDALSDLAYIINRWSVEGAVVPGRESVTLPAGALSRDEAVTRYRAATGADVDDLDYYIVLNHWRSACIAHGVYTRYVRGQKPTDGVDIESFRRSVTARLDQAEAAATSL